MVALFRGCMWFQLGALRLFVWRLGNVILIPVMERSHKPGLCGNVGSVLKQRQSPALSAHACGKECMLALSYISDTVGVLVCAVTNTIISYRANRKFLTDVWLTTSELFHIYVTE